MKANLIPLPSRRRLRPFLDVALRAQPWPLAPQLLDLEMFGLRLPMTGKCLPRVGGPFLRPAPQHVLAGVEIPSRLSDVHPAFPH
jgi:hypothetical protein